MVYFSYTTHWALLLITGVLTVSAMFLDIRTNRIPNILVFTGIVLNLVLGLWLNGYDLWRGQVLALVIATVLWGFFWKIGALGGGDHKMIMMISAAFGFPGVIGYSILVGLCGGVQTLLYLIGHRLQHRSLDWKRWWAKARTKGIPYGVGIGLAFFVMVGVSYLS